MNVDAVYDKMLTYLKFDSNSNVDSPACVIPKISAMIELLEQLDEIGWDLIKDISEDFSKVILSTTDLQNRIHELVLTIGNNFLINGPSLSYKLPRKLEFEWKEGNSLKDVVDLFMTAIDRYQLFWNILDNLDNQTWIIDPDPVMRDHTYRRIGIVPGLSLLIHIDPNDPSRIPECKVLGADELVEKTRICLSKNIENWDEANDLKFNLENVLEVEFCTKSDRSEEDEIYKDCGICYNYRFNGSIPDKVCNDTRCSQTFHSQCLYEWLRFLPSSKQTLNTLFGECPYCSKVITCNLNNDHS